MKVACEKLLEKGQKLNLKAVVRNLAGSHAPSRGTSLRVNHACL